jgi:hypothetical protein
MSWLTSYRVRSRIMSRMFCNWILCWILCWILRWMKRGIRGWVQRWSIPTCSVDSTKRNRRHQYPNAPRNSNKSRLTSHSSDARTLYSAVFVLVWFCLIVSTKKWQERFFSSPRTTARVLHTHTKMDGMAMETPYLDLDV